MEDQISTLQEQLRTTQQLLAQLQSKQEQKEKETSSLPTLKLHTPPSYNGKSSIENWTFQVENFLKGHANVDNKQAVTFTTSLLEGDAATWWRAQGLNEDAFKELQEDWDKFKKEIEAHFRPVDSKKLARDKIANLRQRASVRNYTYEFRRLLLEIGNMSEEEMLDRFIRGLKFNVRKEVELRDPTTLTDAVSIAERYDSISFGLHAQQVSLPPWRSQSSSPFTRSSGPEPMEINAVRSKI